MQNRMLRDTDLPIPQIAESSGYNSASYLTQVFRKEIGITPGQVSDSLPSVVSMVAGSPPVGHPACHSIGRDLQLRATVLGGVGVERQIVGAVFAVDGLVPGTAPLVGRRFDD